MHNNMDYSIIKLSLNKKSEWVAILDTKVVNVIFFSGMT